MKQLVTIFSMFSILFLHIIKLPLKYYRLIFLAILLSQFVKAQDIKDFKTLQSDTFYGKLVYDPYRTLEDTGNLKVKAWMKSEADKATDVFASMPGRKKLREEISEAIKTSKRDEIDEIAYWHNTFYVTKRYPDQQNFSLYAIDKKGKEKLFIDPQKAHPDIRSNNVMLDGFDFSETAPYLIYYLTIGGEERDPKIVLRNMLTGKEIFDPLYRSRKREIMFFDPDRADAFYYSRLPHFNDTAVSPTHWSDNFTVNYHVIGTDSSTDKVIIGLDTSRIKREVSNYVNFQIKKDLPYVYAVVKNKVSDEYRIYVAPRTEFKGTETNWKLITDYDQKVSDYVFVGNYLYLISQKDAPHSKVLKIDLRNQAFDNAEELIPESRKLIKSMAVTKTALLVTVLDAGQGKLIRLPFGSKKADTMAVPLKGNVNIEWHDRKEDFFIISVTSWIKFKEFFTYQPSTKTFTPSVFQKLHASKTAPLVVRDVLVKSHDGVLVPMTIIHKDGLTLDGSHPVSLNGYGAYGSTSDPGFSPESMIYFNAGGIRAIAHVRGGGIYGKEWEMAGKKETKPNTWKDFIACAEFLIDNKYATNKNLLGSGGSAGGITIGRALTERPDLFGAARIYVGALDMIRLENSPNGAGNTSEFGSVSTKKGFEALFEMSAYHHVQNGIHYPMVVLSHGVNDSRVPVWLTLKMGARLQEASASGKPILLKLNFDSGHGFQNSMTSKISDITDDYALSFWLAGMKDFTPAPTKRGF